MTGKIKNIFAEKRYGFIKGDDGKEYFFHQSDFTGNWDDLTNDKKQLLEFEPIPSAKGPRAGKISIV